MTVYFIGAGPGAADLITVRGQRRIAESAVCLYAGSLVPAELLDLCPENAVKVDTARMSLPDIVERIIAADRDGHDVARVHSGDPSIYSAVAEQVRRLEQAGIEYEIVPGVPAFAAAAAALGRELTVPGVGQTVILSRIAVDATAMPPGEELRNLAQTRTTLVLHLAVGHIDRVVSELLPSYGPDCPVAVVAFASRPDEKIVRGTLGTIADAVHAQEIRRTAVIIVGRVLAAEGFPDSYLYSVARTRTTH
ncbi:precorrin-4 C(11)-methyltransferase [Hoyosella subflava]|uniref:Precorrin-4 C(11)-methyltransferase n=1 Tax=Hoyosella subflava (strain DSM 45089 / JCM 17490 / NBRC 109087 / DQS3-9A1) TaxID=443218 RepID=F6EP10_HOYSD|nr:precorrin-4 C(11)-methyltransferase [Hoyosella subflava]AEF40476.1 Precorrin-4 C(11)-methyltransferase [Hoyosella subflava DQS3-9A1]